MREILIGFNPFVLLVIFEDAIKYDLEKLNGVCIHHLSLQLILCLLSINIAEHFNVIKMVMNSLKQSFVIVP